MLPGYSVCASLGVLSKPRFGYVFFIFAVARCASLLIDHRAVFGVVSGSPRSASPSSIEHLPPGIGDRVTFHFTIFIDFFFFSITLGEPIPPSADER